MSLAGNAKPSNRGDTAPAGSLVARPGRSVSADIADWSREYAEGFWCPAKKLLKSIRGYQKWKQRGMLGKCITPFYVLRHRFWSVVTAADIPLNVHIEGGLLLPHPCGIVIHPAAKIGPNCLIFQQVTVGTRSASEGLPEIDGHVDIGAGAKILGPVKIGRHAKIGANAVVLEDVPAGATAVGIPARIVPAPGSPSATD